jgi:signal recognition particle receptor subunit beta
MFYNDVHGIIFVIDSTDIKRMRILNDLIAEVDKDLKRPIPIVFLVNKQDVEKSLTLEDIKNFLDFDKADTNFIWKVE